MQAAGEPWDHTCFDGQCRISVKNLICLVARDAPTQRSIINQHHHNHPGSSLDMATNKCCSFFPLIAISPFSNFTKAMILKPSKPASNMHINWQKQSRWMRTVLYAQSPVFFKIDHVSRIRIRDWNQSSAGTQYIFCSPSRAELSCIFEFQSSRSGLFCVHFFPYPHQHPKL